MTINIKTGLYYEEFGRSDAPTLVFLHGGGVAGWMWRSQVTFFKDRFHCLVPDLPEQGNSHELKPFTIKFAADCVAGVIRDTVRGGKAHVVGLSEGAQVVVELLSRHPDVIDHAVCSSAMLRPMPGQGLYKRELFRTIYRWFMAPFQNNTGWIRLNMRYSAGLAEEYFNEFKKSFQETTEDGFANLMYESMNFRIPPELEKCEVPVLIVVGSREYKQMIQSGRDLLKTLPNAYGVMVSLGKSSSLVKEHNWAMTAPELFNRTIFSWISDQKLPSQLLPLS